MRQPTSVRGRPQPDSRRTVVVALVINVATAGAKVFAALLSGSRELLAEAVRR